MKIFHFAIDGREANVKDKVGSNVYAFEIIKHLAQLTADRPQIKVTVLLAKPPRSDLPSERADWRYQVVTPQKLWTQWAEPIHLYKQQHNYHVLFTPGHYAPRFSAVPYVSSVMDLGFLKFPDHFKKLDLLKLRQWTKYSVERAEKIVAISEFTKQEIHRHYHKELDDIVVAYPDVNFPERRAPRSRRSAFFNRFDLDSHPYFVFVGTLQPRKNLVTLIKAYELFYQQFEQQHPDQLIPKLVIAGKVGWLADDILKAARLSQYQNHLVFTGYISNQLKPDLIENAQALLLIGLYEGFGIPALEAMHLNTVPIVSNTSSLPEVVGDAGLQVNPHKPEQVSQAMLDACSMNRQNLASYRQKARNQIRKFNWNQSAEKILKTLRKVALKRNRCIFS